MNRITVFLLLALAAGMTWAATPAAGSEPVVSVEIKGGVVHTRAEVVIAASARAAEVLHRGFRTDVRPLVAEARRRNGAALDPLATYRAVGYRASTVAARGSDAVATGL